MAPSTLKSQWWNWVARQKVDPHLPSHGPRDHVRLPRPRGRSPWPGSTM